MPSSTYNLFGQAMLQRKQIVCVYDGCLRELCPVILGYSRGEETALAFQFGGQSNSGLPPDGEWRCLRLSKVTRVRLRTGPWRTGDTHRRRQVCVEEVDMDVNPASPYRPKHRMRG